MTIFSSPQSPAAEYSASRTRTIALIGLFSALYIVLAGVVGSFLGTLAQGYPEHFLRGLLMAALVVRTRKMWSATTMGVVCGLVFAAVPSPYPAVFITISTVLSGLVFDISLATVGSYAQSTASKFRVMLGSGISGVVESVSLLSLVTFYGLGGKLITFSALAKILSISTISVAWGIDIVFNIVLSLFGAYIAYAYISPSTKVLKAKKSQVSQDSKGSETYPK